MAVIVRGFARNILIDALEVHVDSLEGFILQDTGTEIQTSNAVNELRRTNELLMKLNKDLIENVGE